MRPHNGFSVQPATKLTTCNDFRFHTAARQRAAAMEAERLSTRQCFPMQGKAGQCTAKRGTQRHGKAVQSNARQGFNLRAWRSGSASALGADGRGFKSRLPDHLFPLLPLPVETPAKAADSRGRAQRDGASLNHVVNPHSPAARLQPARHCPGRLFFRRHPCANEFSTGYLSMARRRWPGRRCCCLSPCC